MSELMLFAVATYVCVRVSVLAKSFSLFLIMFRRYLLTAKDNPEEYGYNIVLGVGRGALLECFRISHGHAMLHTAINLGLLPNESQQGQC